MTGSPVNEMGTRIVVSGLRQMKLPGAADYVEELARERRALIEKAQHVIECSHVTTRGGSLHRGAFVEGPAFSALEELVALLEEPTPQPRPHLTVHNGGSPPARATSRRVSTPEGDPA